jgi:3-isopropylmalate/(R)-2-methylmalate dehydratase large subunit
MNSSPRTIIDKIWQTHCVRDETADAPAILYVDLHLVHEVTSPQAFAELRARGVGVRRPERTLVTLDHSTPTLPANADGSLPFNDAATAEQVHALERNCAEFGLALHGFGSGTRGVVHVMGPELGATQPGMTIVCGDSHTATHGAFGALAFGIGTTEVGHVLATQCLLQRRPKTMAVTVDGKLPAGVGAKGCARCRWKRG